MTGAVVPDPNRRAAEYLQLLQSLAEELEVAMGAISRDALLDLEESLVDQEALGARLRMLAGEASLFRQRNPAAASARSPAGIDSELANRMIRASNTLQQLNREYAALLQYSSRSAAMMVSLLSSCKGQFQEASGSRLKVQTWSCQM